MLGIFLLATTFVMLGLVWFNEGWQAALKFIFVFLVIGIVGGLLLSLLNMENYSRVFGCLLWGGFAVFLLLFNLAKGYFRP